MDTADNGIHWGIDLFVFACFIAFMGIGFGFGITFIWCVFFCFFG